MLKTPKRYGSFRGAVVAGIAMTPFFALAPVFTFIFVGLIVGIVARGIYRSIVAAILSGLIVTSLVIVYAVIDSNSIVYSVANYASSTFYFAQAVVRILDHVAALGTIALLETLMLYAVAIPVLGAFIGGLIRPGY